MVRLRSLLYFGYILLGHVVSANTPKGLQKGNVKKVYRLLTIFMSVSKYLNVMI